MSFIIIFTVLLGHWFGDFVLQKKSKGGRRNKSIWKNIVKNFKELFPHTIIYSIILTIFIAILQFVGCFGNQQCDYINILFFFLTTFVCHVIIDNVVININSEFLKKNQRYNFFVSIGFDQFIHYLSLFGTIQLLYYY